MIQQFGWWDKLEDPVSPWSPEKVENLQSLHFLESPKCWREPTPKSTIMQVPDLSSEFVVNVQVVVLNIRIFPTSERMQCKTPPRQNIEAERINYILLTSRHRGYNFEQLILFETRRGLETQYSQVFQICKVPNFSRYFWIEDITPQSPGEPLIGKISNTWKDLTRNQVFSLLEPGTRKRHSKFLEDGIISTQENKN